jgi:hypothetical protein
MKNQKLTHIFPCVVLSGSWIFKNWVQPLIWFGGTSRIKTPLSAPLSTWNTFVWQLEINRLWLAIVRSAWEWRFLFIWDNFHIQRPTLSLHYMVVRFGIRSGIRSWVFQNQSLCVNVGIIKENTKKIDNQGRLLQQTNPYFMGLKRLIPCVAQEKKISQRPCSLGYG